MFWQFGELGYDVSINFIDRLARKPIRWNYLNEPDRKSLFEVYSALIHLKQEHEVFRTETSMLVYLALRNVSDSIIQTMNVCIIGNFDVIGRSANPGFQHTGIWYDFFSGDSISVSNSSDPIALDPGEYHIYTDVRLSNPQDSGTVSIRDYGLDASLEVYPIL